MPLSASSIDTQGTITPPSSWAFPINFWHGPDPNVSPIAQTGSNLGVPGSTTISDGGASNSSAAMAFGQTVTARGILGQPLMWAFILMMIAVIGFAHMAHHEVRA